MYLIFFEFKGSPTPGRWHYESYSVAPQEDAVAMENSLNQKKSTRLSFEDYDRLKSQNQDVLKTQRSGNINHTL